MAARLRTLIAAGLPALLFAVQAWANVDLVTLPGRDRTQITIYNSADLTLVRDIRTLTMKKGQNRLQFSWANTLIDPTSLDLLPLGQARKFAVQGLEYPPRATGLGIWQVEAATAEPAPFEISCFTSGISWRAYYLATLGPEEKTMALAGYVRVHNGSGEDYERVETRLVVGQIHLLDRIAELARRQWPHGRPGPEPAAPGDRAEAAAEKDQALRAAKALLTAAPRVKEIRKEGISEYYLYAIEGTEDLENGWGKRLLSFSAPEVPVRNLYRYEEERYGKRPVRFLLFANDRAHGLGKEPLPAGQVKVFRRLDGQGRLAYVGGQEIRYAPVGDEVALQLGAAEEVAVIPTVMEKATDNYEWRDNKIAGWDEHLAWRVEVKNFRDVPVRVEVRRRVPAASWEIRQAGDAGRYEKIDKNTIQYTLELPPHGRKEFLYRLTLHQGTRAH